MESIVNTIPAQPRTVAIAFRSWLGSSQTLVTAADELLTATGRIQGTGGAIFWYIEPGTPRKFLVVNGVAGKTTMSIAQLQGILSAIEERLNDGHPARAGGLLKADLLWVEGADVHGPDLQLPSPDLLGTDWGLEAFVAAAEDPFADACKAGRESKTFCHQVGGKYRGTKRTNVREENADMWFYGKSVADEMVFGGVAVETTEDIIAQAVGTLSYGSSAYHFPPTSSWDIHHLGDYAQERYRKIRSTEIVAVEAPVRAGAGTTAAAESWLNAARAAAEKNGVAVARSVVFELGAERIRGAILGAKISAAQPGPLPPVRSIDIKQSHPPLNPARDTQGWTVELHVPSRIRSAAPDPSKGQP